MSSRVVERGGMVYISSAPPELSGDVAEQTRRTLLHIDRLLALAGTDKSRLLTVQIRLPDLELLPAHQGAWDEWLGAQSAPIRAVQQAPLASERLVEIAVTATKPH